MKLSLSMIVKNEERFLPGCLESVRDLVDEMIIVDTGSSDATREIAESFGARLFDFPWCDDFSAARNESLKHTTGDWILYLDADERISKAYHSQIRRLISGGKAEAFLLNLNSRIGTKDDAQYHLVAYPRLFRKLKGVCFAGKVHEQITSSLNSLRARIVQSDVIVDHLGYAQDEEVIFEKARRNHRLLLEQVERRENYGYALYQLGQTEIILGEIDRGLAHLQEALAAGGFGKSVEASIYGIIAENKSRKGDEDAALIACDKSLAAAPEQVFARLLKGEIYMKLGKYQDAKHAFVDAIKHYEGGNLAGKTTTAIEPVFAPDVLFTKLGRAASLAEDDETAKLFLGKAAKEKRITPKVAAYLEVLLRQKSFAEVFEAAREFREFENEDWFLRLVSSAYIDTGNFAEAAKLLGRISNHDAVTLSSLANCKMKTGDLEGCESAFKESISLGYNDPEGLELLGLVQFKLLKFRESVETLSGVFQANPTNQRVMKFIQAAKAQAGLGAIGK
jgi:glycosyltransferase involved in cell wall biosynthesis